MESLSYDDLIDIVVALDNEACSRPDSEARKLRSLKWRVFALATEKAPQNGSIDLGNSNLSMEVQ